MPFQAEGSASDRATLYTLGERRFWWNEVEWLDRWFEEEIWMEAAAKHWNEEIGEPEDFVEHMTTKEEER